jgi:glycogen operon protein
MQISVQISDGEPEPLGVSATPHGVNVAVYSAHASAIEFCLFDETGEIELTRIALPARLGPIFHGHISGVCVGQRYGLRAHGPFDPSRGLRFNPNKLLIDPYALHLDRPFTLDPSMFEEKEADQDSAAKVPKAVLQGDMQGPAPRANWVSWDKTIIYELHVRGFTKTRLDIPEDLRGTFAGLAHPAAIRHLRRLGVTAVELLPCAAWIDERHLPPLGLSNYWGYNPIAFMAPDPRLAPGGWAEVRATVDALADAGIETLLDVVFNHTGEGDALGPTLSLRGLDNACYYRLSLNDPATYVNDAGTGNILALDHPAALRLTMDALRTWRRLGGVSGFRFDLATILGRRAEGFDPGAPLLLAISQDPDLRDLKLIAEPWDCGPGGYQLGRFPPAWGEWNDRYRDTVRGFWRGDALSLGELAQRFSGSKDELSARSPSRSINFITAHDGFTLADLVAYSAKRNDANGEYNRDGTDDNRSWNNGVEGPTDDPAILAARRADQRALLATLLLSRGTPMLSMGMELGQSQGGNNNAYAQDNTIGWLDWAGANQGLIDFTARLIALRRNHAALRADRFLSGEPGDRSPYPDVEWRRADGGALTHADWDRPDGETLVISLSATDGERLDRVVIILHRGPQPIEVALPQAQDGTAWSLAVDSADVARTDVVETASVAVSPRSVLLLVQMVQPRRKRLQADDATLDRLAEVAGIAPLWWSLEGEPHKVSRDTKIALLHALNLPAATTEQCLTSLHQFSRTYERRPLPHALCGDEDKPAMLEVKDRDGAGPLHTWLRLESQDGSSHRLRLDGATGEAFEQRGSDGRRLSGRRVSLPPLSAGRYKLRREDAPDATCALTIAPSEAYTPPWLKAGERRFGLTAQLYSLRRHGDQGLGDLSTLGDLAEAAGARGATLVAINPLHALFFGCRDRASPYYPSDRRFLDPLYIDLAKVPFCEPGSLNVDALTGAAAIDYDAVWTMKSAALAHSFKRGGAAPDFLAFTAACGPALQQFAVFQALSDHFAGAPWRTWPEAYQRPLSPAIQAFAKAHKDEISYQIYLQWLLETQLAAAAGRAGAVGVGICRDLAVGAAPDGVEQWAYQDQMAQGACIGAPPDPFAPQGQVWGLPPLNPHTMAKNGYVAMAGLFAANMRHADALRVDHVLGMTRQFWVPDGAEGSAGAYVAFPFQSLMAELKLESVSAECMVIGEDLGTVPNGLRDALADARCLSYRVLPFEREDVGFRRPEAYPRLAFACAATHDLPPLAGWWLGADIEERLSLSLVNAAQAQKAMEDRTSDRLLLVQALKAAGFDLPSDAGPGQDLLAAIHGYLAQTSAALAMIQLEDMAGETIGVNLPGTDFERPNWRRRLNKTLEEIMDSDLAHAILTQVRIARHRT